jgi:hypothetical protein
VGRGELWRGSGCACDAKLSRDPTDRYPGLQQRRAPGLMVVQGGLSRPARPGRGAAAGKQARIGRDGRCAKIRCAVVRGVYSGVLLKKR